MKVTKIAVFENNEELVADIKDRISVAEGFEVCAESANGNAALELIMSAKPDVAIVDLVLMGLDGFGVLSTMNKYNWIDSVPVIMISAESTHAFIERAYDKTMLKCKELKWPYMNKILCSWHEKGLHTLEAVNAGDRPGRPAASRRDAEQSAREDMARMEKYLEQLRREKEAE